MYTSILARFFLVIGGINYLFWSVGNVNVFTTLIKNDYVNKVIGFIIGMSALYFIFDRDYYLPFLSKTVFPLPSLASKKDANTSVTLKNLPPNTIVVYWAANKSNSTIENPWKAYDEYQNSGIAVTNAQGTASIDIECPAVYKVSKFGMNKNLKKHIHFRYELPKYKGMFSRVFTKYIDC